MSDTVKVLPKEITDKASWVAGLLQGLGMDHTLYCEASHCLLVEIPWLVEQLTTSRPDPADERREQGYPRGEAMPYPLTDDDTEVQCPRCGKLVQPGAHTCLPQTLGEGLPASIANVIAACCELRKHGDPNSVSVMAEAVLWLFDERSRLLTALEEKEKELQLAIAHDRQPYPTAHAYEMVCKSRDRWQNEYNRAANSLDVLTGKYEDLQSASVLQKEELEQAKTLIAERLDTDLCCMNRDEHAQAICRDRPCWNVRASAFVKSSTSGA